MTLEQHVGDPHPAEAAGPAPPAGARFRGWAQLTAALWTLGILNFGTNLVRIVDGQGYDTIPIWRAVRGLLTNGDIYTARGSGDFLYFPSALLMLLPLGALDVPTAKAALFFLNLAAILASAAALLRLFGFRLFGLAGAIALCGISLAWPVFFTLGAGNVDALVLLGVVGFLLAASRHDWTRAGVALGLAIALKPVVVPLLVIPALYRRWRAVAMAVLVPSALSAAVLAAAPHSRAFFSQTLPLLWHGQDVEIQHVSFSLSSVGDRLGVPGPLTDSLRLAVLVGAVALLFRRWRGSDDEPHRLIEVSTIVLAAAFLLSTFAFPFYGVYFLPFAVAAAAPSSHLRHWLTWAALFCVAAEQPWSLDRFPHKLNQLLDSRVTLGFLLVLVAVYVGVRRASVVSPAARRAGSPAGPAPRTRAPASAE